MPLSQEFSVIYKLMVLKDLFLKHMCVLEAKHVSLKPIRIVSKKSYIPYTMKPVLAGVGGLDDHGHLQL